MEARCIACVVVAFRTPSSTELRISRPQGPTSHMTHRTIQNWSLCLFTFRSVGVSKSFSTTTYSIDAFVMAEGNMTHVPGVVMQEYGPVRVLLCVCCCAGAICVYRGHVRQLLILEDLRASVTACEEFNVGAGWRGCTFQHGNWHPNANSLGRLPLTALAPRIRPRRRSSLTGDSTG